ncbi:MAG: diaminopimelate decarboxylase [Candidatus Lokiarchaeota archaeon]|nr:diaminopimelate decarboxylase [Candidatus Lokiarchaeota archaeon]
MNKEDWLKKKDLEYKSNELFYGDIRCSDLAEQYGTPVYIINEDLIRERYRILKELLDSVYENNEIHYAVKANSNLSVLKILNSEGSSVDCSSAGEVFLSLKAGFPSDKILYTGNMFTNEDFRYAIENDVNINLDSISQLDRLTRIYEDLGKKKGTISFRINPEFGAGHHAHTITAGREIKFGILNNQVIKAYKKAKDYGFTRFGTHIHIGSGIIDATDYEKAIGKYTDIVMNLADTLDIKFEFIDFGGGLGIPYNPEQEPLDLIKYKEIVIKPMVDLLEQHKIGKPVIKIEPGRFIVAEAGIILTQINTKKDNGYKKFLGIDAGFNTLIRPTMYGSYHHIIPCKLRTNAKVNNYDVAGPICESGDILGRNRAILEPNEEDYLAILDVGAYGFVMSSVYNSRPRAPEVLIKDKKSYLIRKAEEFKDLIEKQKVPKHLK